MFEVVFLLEHPQWNHDAGRKSVSATYLAFSEKEKNQIRYRSGKHKQMPPSAGICLPRHERLERHQERENASGHRGNKSQE